MQRNPQATAIDASRQMELFPFDLLFDDWCRGEQLCSVWQISTTSRSFCRKTHFSAVENVGHFFLAFVDVVPSVVEQKNYFSVILLKAIFDSVGDLGALIA